MFDVKQRRLNYQSANSYFYMESWGWWRLSRETKNASPGTHLVFSTQWQHFILLETDCKTTSEKVNLEGESHLIRPHHLLTASFRGQDNLWGSLQLLCADNSATFVISLFTAISGAVPPDNENNRPDMLNQTSANAQIQCDLLLPLHQTHLTLLFIKAQDY